MGLIVKKKSGKNGLIGIWDLDGEEFEHLKSLNLTNTEPDVFNKISLPKKKMQWLAVRILLQELTGNREHLIIYDEFNKPSIKNSSTCISISHSENKVAIILEPNHATGIDIEIIRPKIERIASKFMSETEMRSLSKKDTIEKLYVYWCAKEALYKFYGKKEILFREHLHIEPFEYNGSGTIKGIIKKGGKKTSLDLCYEKMDEYMLVYINIINIA